MEPFDREDAAGDAEPGPPGAWPGEPAPETFVPPDEADFAPQPDEVPPLELWRAVGDVPPWATLFTLLAWGVVFLLMAAHHEFDDAAAMLARGANVAQHDPMDSAWRLLAATFVHGGPGHVAMNALSLLVLGPAAERIFTRAGYAILFAYGGAAASLASLAWRLHHYGPGPSYSIGGSGALFALGGALLVAAWRLRRQLAVGRARAFAAVVMMLTLPGLAGGFQRWGTDNAAHLGGLAAGVLLGAIVPLHERLGGHPNAVSRLAGALGALALVLTFARVVRG